MTAVNPTGRQRPAPTRLDAWQNRVAAFYDLLATPHRREQAGRLMIYLATLGFLSHLGLVFLVQNVPALARFAVVVGSSYLSAIYTPFVLILFYEVLLLVLSIPQSTTLAVGAQFEIISLITIRNVFKDLTKFDDFSHVDQQFDAFVTTLTDMFGGLLLFLLVAVFYHINRRRTSREQFHEVSSLELERFIARKKIIALGLSVLLFGLAALSLWTWGVESYRAIFEGFVDKRTLTTIFYADFFTILIFTDVLILILSLLLTDSYQLVFRNAGFVISTVMLRISLSAAHPYSLIAAIIGILFGVLVLRIYLYFMLVGPLHDLPTSGDHE